MAGGALNMEIEMRTRIRKRTIGNVDGDDDGEGKDDDWRR
jgi:hypothetical protein